MAKKLGLALVIVALFALAWYNIPKLESAQKKQGTLVERAKGYLEERAYVTAVDLLEQAAGFRTKMLPDVEELLKEAYLGAGGFERQYKDLLEKQMSESGAQADVFLEAAGYFFDNNKLQNAILVLKEGVEKTGDAGLTALFEKERYAFTYSQGTYDEVTDFLGAYIQVKRDGMWGIANSTGQMLIPCMYEKISSYSGGQALVAKDGEIYAVNNKNQRTALLKKNDKDLTAEDKDKPVRAVIDFGNIAQSRVAVQMSNGKWKRASTSFTIAAAEYDEVGTHSSNYVAVKKNGKWGVMDSSGDYLIPAEHDGVVMDAMGRCYNQGAVFVRDGGTVFLYVNGKKVEGKEFEDALPFNAEGPAAVKVNGLWGFVGTDGEFKIAAKYEEALSFSGHLAAVRQGALWGYLALTGDFGIEPQFAQAKSFYNGSAPVLTETGWKIIMLTEFAKGAGLF